MKIKKTTFWSLFLFGFWLALSGRSDLFHISLGLFSTFLVVGLHRKLSFHPFFPDQQSREPLRLFFFIFSYLPWLIYQIVLAAWAVTKAVLSPKLSINPALLKFSTALPNNASKVILGNSITLTPGTITVELEGDEFLVHGLMESSYSSLVEGSFQTMIARNYQAKPDNVLKNITIIDSRKNLY